MLYAFLYYVHVSLLVFTEILYQQISLNIVCFIVNHSN